VLNQAPRHEDVLGSGNIVPRILDLGTRWRRVVSFTPRPLYPQGRIIIKRRIRRARNVARVGEMSPVKKISICVLLDSYSAIMSFYVICEILAYSSFLKNYAYEITTLFVCVCVCVSLSTC
jgi:hypothetical protein